MRIRTKVITIAFFSMILLGSILTLSHIFSQNAVLNTSFNKLGMQITRSIAHHINELILLDDNEAIHKILLQEKDSDKTIMVISVFSQKDQTLIAQVPDNVNFRTRDIVFKKNHSHQNNISSEVDTFIDKLIISGEEIRFFTLPLSISSNTVPTYIILLGLNTKELKQQIKQVYKIGSLFTAIATLICTIVLSSFFVPISNAVNSLKNSTISFASGNFSRMDLPLKRDDEIGELAQAFQNMVLELQKTTVSKNFLDGIIQQLSNSLMVLDPNGKIQMVNNATLTLLGYSEHELINKSVEIIFEDTEKEKEIVSNIVTLDEIYKKHSLQNYDKLYKCKEGKTIPVLFSSSTLLDENGNITNIICVARNISERIQKENELKLAYSQLKEAQSQLVQAGKMAALGTLGAGIAHELNNPLTIIQGYAEELIYELKEHKDYSDEFSEMAEHILNASDRMKQIVNHIRDFSREQKTSHFEIVLLKRCIDDSLIFIRKQLEDQNIRFELHISDDQIKVWGNRIKIESIFLNLIGNAKDAFDKTKQNKYISIDITDNGSDMVIVKISDNAGGMPEKVKTRIFEPFFTTKEAGKGTGLGLSLVYNIIKEHNGSITCESTENEGTTFIVTLKKYIRENQFSNS